MIDKKEIYRIIDEFEAKHIVTDIILLGKDEKVRRIIILTAGDFAPAGCVK